MTQDIRWHQGFSNYQKALAQLQSAVELSEERELTQLEKQGLIHIFEFTHELAWKTLKDFLISRGASDLFGSKDVTCEAFKLDLIEDGETWMQMIKSRNLTSHTYDEETVEQIVDAILGNYITELEALNTTLQRQKKKELSS